MDSRPRNPETLRATIDETRRHWCDRLIELATAAYRARDYAQAAELLIRALALDPAQAARIEAAGQRVRAKAGGGSVASRLTLTLQTACRLAVAEVPETDIQTLLNWNTAAAGRDDGVS